MKFFVYCQVVDKQPTANATAAILKPIADKNKNLIPEDKLKYLFPNSGRIVCWFGGEKMKKGAIYYVQYFSQRGWELKKRYRSRDLPPYHIFVTDTTYVYLAEDIDFNTPKKTTMAVVIDSNQNHDESCRALNFLEKNKRCFLTGAAGTGKTFTISKFLEKERRKPNHFCFAVAPTGVAAEKLGATTTHYFFGILTSQNTNDAIINALDGTIRSVSALSRMRQTKTLIIDEISMVSSEHLNVFDILMRHAKNDLCNPFGDVKIILVGDFYQLPPHGNTSNYCFDSEAWKQSDFRMFYLKTIRRQQDEDFCNILNKIRVGDTDESVITFLFDRIRNGVNGEFLHLHSHRNEVANLNLNKINELTDDNCALRYEITTEYGTAVSQNQDVENNTFPIDSKLTLAIGAKVMIRINDQGETKRFVNGTIGKVVGITNIGDQIEKISVEIADQKRIDFSKHTFSSLDENGQNIPDRWAKNFPLSLAYAMTIHKSQGLSIPQIAVNFSKAFSPGQVYVALSRAMTAESLALEGFERNSDKIQFEKTIRQLVTVNKAVDVFYKIQRLKNRLNLIDDKNLQNTRNNQITIPSISLPTPTTEQEQILEFVKNHRGNILVKSVAGAGNTTVLSLIYSTLNEEQKRSCALLVASEEVSKELQSKGIPAMTFSTTGFLVMEPNNGNKFGEYIDELKVQKIICKDYVREKTIFRNSLLKLVKHAKVNGQKPSEDITNEKTWHKEILAGMEDIQRLLEQTKVVLEINNKNKKTLDYDDMLYLPFVEDKHFKQYKFIIVDQVQDLTPMHFVALEKMCIDNSRVFGVGDTEQAIFADHASFNDSMDEFIYRFEAYRYDLNLSIRCPPSHIDKIRSDLHGFERFLKINSNGGKHIEDGVEDVSELSPEKGDLIILDGRIDIDKIFLELLEKQKKIRTPGDNSIYLINRFVLENTSCTKEIFLNWANRLINLQRIVDTAAPCLDIKFLKALVENNIIETDKYLNVVVGLKKYLETDSENSVTIATIERAKGLEADKVWVVGRELLLQNARDSDDPQKQNRYYVAMTRSKRKIMCLIKDGRIGINDTFINWDAFREKILFVKANPWSDQYKNEWILNDNGRQMGYCVGFETYKTIMDQCREALENKFSIYVTCQINNRDIVASVGKVGEIRETGRQNLRGENLFFVGFIDVSPVDGNPKAPNYPDGLSYLWVLPKIAKRQT